MDLYERAAYFWGVPRYVAKTRLMEVYWYKCGQVGVGGLNSTASLLQPQILSCLPNEARAELMAELGYVVGEN